MKQSKSLLYWPSPSFFSRLPALPLTSAFDKQVHDFNTAIEGAKLPHSFTFRNTVREPSKAKNSSPAEAPSRRSQRVIQPGRKVR